MLNMAFRLKKLVIRDMAEQVMDSQRKGTAMVTTNWIIYVLCVANTAWAAAIALAYMRGGDVPPFLHPNGFVMLLPTVLIGVSIIEHVGRRFSKSILWTLFINMVAISFMAFVCFSGL